MICCGNCLRGIDSSDWYWSDVENDLVWYPGWTCGIDSLVHSDIHRCPMWIPRNDRVDDMEKAMVGSHDKRMEKMI